MEEPKQIKKDKYGEIIINTLETYIEPKRQIKEARGEDLGKNKNIKLNFLS